MKIFNINRYVYIHCKYGVKWYLDSKSVSSLV